MIKISYKEPLKRNFTVSFSINGKTLKGKIQGDYSNYYISPSTDELVPFIEEIIGYDLKSFYSKILKTSLDKYSCQYWPEESLENLKIVLKALEEYFRVKRVEFEKPLKDESKVKFITPHGIFNSHVSVDSFGTAFIWIEDTATDPETLVQDLCGESIEKVYSNAGAEITCPGGWPFSTLKDLEKVLDYINKKCRCETSTINSIKQQNGNEIKLQRTEGVIRKGTVPKGSGICGKIHKATISSRLLENTAIFG
jgi:hypothetical protein